jgi:molybdopterin-guanine dinucleotide biosynthesis protein A
VSQARPTKPARAVAVVILAGGASSRLGRDKTRVRVGGRTLLQHVRAAARATGWPVRVLRRDAVPQCGPLGGLVTALRDATAEVTVFVPCDMPFLTAAIIQQAAVAVSTRHRTVCFVDGSGRAGFPLAAHRRTLALAERLIARGEVSVQAFVRAARARRLPIPPRQAWRWFNVNTPDDLTQARQQHRAIAGPGKLL